MSKATADSIRYSVGVSAIFGDNVLRTVVDSAADARVLQTWVLVGTLVWSTRSRTNTNDCIRCLLTSLFVLLCAAHIFNEGLKVHDSTEQQLMMDMDIVFNGEPDVTVLARQSRFFAFLMVVVDRFTGKGAVSLEVQLTDLQFSGRLRVRLTAATHV